MPGLVLKLRAGERVLVNGAVLESVDRPSRLRVLTRDTDILRLRDAIDPEAATTPVTRLAHLLQMIVAGAVPRDAARTEALTHIDQLRPIFDRAEDRDILDRVTAELTEGQPYRALRAIQSLLQSEARLLDRMAG